MNKTLTINLAGQVFHIEEDAYLELRNYLESLKMYFRNNEGFREIIDDIEARMAEMFRAKLKSNREVVVMEDVKEAITVMGKPEDFAEVLDEEEERVFEETVQSDRGRLYRNPDDRILSGVCGGLGAYFNTDPLWFRLLFVVFLFIPGPSILVYIILWILIPEAKTPAQKLEMRREKVTISSIERSIKDEYGRFKKKVDEFGASPSGSRARQFMNNTADGASDFFTTFFKILAKVIVVFAVIIAALAIFGLTIAALIGLFSADPKFFSLAQRLYENDQHMLGHWISLVIVFLIPLLAIIYYGLRYLLKAQGGVKGLGISAALLWVIALGVMIYTSIILGMGFKDQGEVTQQVNLSSIESDTLHLDMASVEPYRQSISLTPLKLKDLNRSAGLIHVSGDFNNISLEIRRGDTVKMHMVKISQGRNIASAELLADNIDYEIQQEHNRIIIPPTIVLNESDTWRNQRIKLILYVPQGKTLTIDPALSSFLNKHFVYSIWKESGEFTIHGRGNKNNKVLPGITYRMDSTGLVCLDCDSFNTEFIKQMGYESKIFAISDIARTLYVRDNLKVYVQQGNERSVTMYAKPGYLEEFIARESGEKLILEKEDNDWQHFNYVFLVVRMPEVESLVLSGASYVTLVGEIHNLEQITASGASQVRGKVNSKNMYLKLSGASGAELSGVVEDLKIKAGGVCMVEATELEAGNGEVHLSGASSVRVNVSGIYKTKTTGASSVKNVNSAADKNKNLNNLDNEDVEW